jgi:hypothetical protein
MGLIQLTKAFDGNGPLILNTATFNASTIYSMSRDEKNITRIVVKEKERNMLSLSPFGSDGPQTHHYQVTETPEQILELIGEAKPTTASPDKQSQELANLKKLLRDIRAKMNEDFEDPPL